MSYHLGVDLGTTYTAAAVAREGRATPVTLAGRSIAVPSVVHLSPDGTLVVGDGAERRALTEPSRVAREFKRRVGDPTPILVGGAPMAAELLMARTLDWVVRQVSTNEGGPPATLAVTHPANWGEYKLDLLRQAVRHVGLAVDQLIPEPVAAASFYAGDRDLPSGTVVAVYDLGGGTFDASVVRIDPAGDGFRIVGEPVGIERLGGIDFDHAVFSHVATTVGLDVDALDVGDPRTAAALAQLRASCVDGKEALSTDTDVSIAVMLPELHTTVRLTRSELEDMIRPSLDETLVALRRAVDSADVAVEDLHAVLLVGGSSRIPLIAQMVTAQLGRPAAVDARPKETISLGAALAAAQAAHAAQAAPTAASPTAGPPAPVAAAAPPPTPGAGQAATVASPSGPPTAPPPTAQPALPEPTPGSGNGRSRQVLLVALIVLIVGAAMLAGFLLRDDGDGESAGDDPTTTTTAPNDTTDDDDGATTTTADPDDDGTSGSGSVRPLPGDDWNDEARTVFVEDAAANPTFAGTAAALGVEPEGLASCTYDEMERSGDITFEQLQESWTREDTPPSDPAVQALIAASAACVSGPG